MITAYAFDGTSYYLLCNDPWAGINDPDFLCETSWAEIGDLDFLYETPWAEVSDFDLSQTLDGLEADGIEVYGADSTDLTQPWILQESEDGYWIMENKDGPLD